MNSTRLPVHLTTDDLELKQTTAIFYYTCYHGECLRLVINDTLNSKLMDLHGVLHNVNVDCLKIIISYIKDMQVSTMLPEQILDGVQVYMGNIAKPPSMKGAELFMKNVASVGILLEKIVEDWRYLRDVCKSGTEQVIHLITEVIDKLRTTYTENTEYKFTMDLLQIAQAEKLPMNQEIKLFFQSCIVATQIQANCLSLGLLQLVLLTPSTLPCLIAKYLTTEIETIFGTIPKHAITKFQEKLYEIYRVFETDPQYALCDISSAIYNPMLVKSALTRSFFALKSLIGSTHLARKYELEINQGFTMIDSALPSMKENVRQCLPPTPTCLADVYAYYDMIVTEKTAFNGSPTDVMIARWGHGLFGLMKYLESVGQKTSDLYNEIGVLCRQILNLNE